MMMKNFTNVEVKASAIQGRGVFAKKDFKPKATVLVWDTSHEVDENEINHLPESKRNFMTRYKGKWIVMQEPMRFVNHSCEANTRSENGEDVAVCKIKAGEEITSDYRSEKGRKDGMSLWCGDV